MITSMQLQALFTTLLLVVVLSFTGTAQPFAADQDTLTILVLGSSTAAGAGPSHRDSAWVPRYVEYLETSQENVRLINLALGGYTTYHCQEDGYIPPPGRYNPDTLRNISRALILGASAVIINLPSNDAALGFSIEEQIANFERIVSAAESRGVPLWVCTTQPRNLNETGRQNLITMRDWIRTRFTVKSIDFWTDLAESDGRIIAGYDAGDGVHLNDPAHALLFERVRNSGIPESIRGTTTVQSFVQVPKSMKSLIYPNPLSGPASISFNLTESGQTRLTVTDLLGHSTSTEYLGYLDRGPHVLPLDLRSSPSGVYFYHIRAGEFHASGKILKKPR